MQQVVQVAPRTTVRFQAPVLPPLAEAARYFAESERTRWFANGGPCATLLAERLASSIGSGVEAVPVANATVGLLVALRAAFGTPDDHAGRALVAVPSFTFVATSAAVRWAGFEPLWVDVDADGWHVDPFALDDALARHDGAVAGVLACSTFGTPPSARSAAAVAGLAAAYGVPVVYDSAAAWGATDDADRPAGRAGAAEVFSFHATKPMAAGEGGVVTTADPDVAAAVRALANFGFSPDRRLVDVGINAKMSELTAAVALAALDRYDAALRSRRERAAAMRAGLETHGWTFQAGAERSTVQFVPVLAPDAEAKARAMARAAQAGVELRAYFDPPLHREDAFADVAAGSGLGVTDDLAARMLSLPMAEDLPADAVELVVDVCAG